MPTVGDVIEAHGSLELLNQESDNTAGYVQRMCRQQEPILEEVRDLDVRVKLERRHEL